MPIETLEPRQILGLEVAMMSTRLIRLTTAGINKRNNVSTKTITSISIDFADLDAINEYRQEMEMFNLLHNQ